MEEQQDKDCYHYTRKDEIYQTNLVEVTRKAEIGINLEET
jgi:hypothetical protein